MALKPDRFCHPETHTLNHSYQVFTIVSVPNVIVFCVDPKMPIWRVPRNCSLCEIITENWLAYIFPPGLIDTVVLISILQEWALSHEVYGNSLVDRVFFQPKHSDLSNKGKVRCFWLNTDFFSRPNCAKASGVIQHNYTLFSSLLKNASDERGHCWNHKKSWLTKNSCFSTTPQQSLVIILKLQDRIRKFGILKVLHKPTSDLFHHLKTDQLTLDTIIFNKKYENI